MTGAHDPAGSGERSDDARRSAAASVAALRDAIGTAASRRSIVRTAARGGRPVVVLRLVPDESDAAGPATVECDVYPLNSLRVEPLRPGPYGFATTAEASEFLEEAMLTLRYLGCDVTP